MFKSNFRSTHVAMPVSGLHCAHLPCLTWLYFDNHNSIFTLFAGVILPYTDDVRR